MMLDHLNEEKNKDFYKERYIELCKLCNKLINATLNENLLDPEKDPIINIVLLEQIIDICSKRNKFIKLFNKILVLTIIIINIIIYFIG